jgi:SnoaL-like domain
MTPREQLENYCEAFNRRDLEKALALFAVRALFEMPLLGQRLIGRREIAAGLARVFEVTQNATLQISAVEEAAPLAMGPLVMGPFVMGPFVMGEGRLTARLHRDPAPVSIPLAVALESEAGGIARLSMYLDAHPYRLWTDGPIFASHAPQPKGTP